MIAKKRIAQTNVCGYSFKRFHINDNIIYKIPPNLPLPKGGFIPLFGKEGQGEIF
jgi:hypothetical protein